jgi:hypothetical protein
MKVRAATWENATFTAGHASYRAHLENLRLLLANVEFVIARDSDEAARWFRRHGKKTKSGDDKPRVCPKLPWLKAYLDSVRYRWKGKLAAELVQEAAKDAVRMAGVHAEYLLMEGVGHVDSDRYRREEK